MGGEDARSSSHKKYPSMQDTIFDPSPAEITLAQSPGPFQNSERQQRQVSLKKISLIFSCHKTLQAS